jgi:hypothetical protein
VQVIDRTRQFLVDDLGSGPILLNWDYGRDLPRDVPAGEFAERSIEMVNESEVLIGVLGPTVPPITRREILRGYERQARGEQVRAYLLGDPSAWGADHERLLRKVRRDFRRDVQFGHYHSRPDFFHVMYLTLFGYLLERGHVAQPSQQLGVIQ